MTGGEAPNGVPTANGVALALAQNPVAGATTITINQQDDAVNGKHDAEQGAKNMQTLANDRRPVASSGRTTPTSRRRRSRSAMRPA